MGLSMAPGMPRDPYLIDLAFEMGLDPTKFSDDDIRALADQQGMSAEGMAPGASGIGPWLKSVPGWLSDRGDEFIDWNTQRAKEIEEEMSQPSFLDDKRDVAEFFKGNVLFEDLSPEAQAIVNDALTAGGGTGWTGDRERDPRLIDKGVYEPEALPDPAIDNDFGYVQPEGVDLSWMNENGVPDPFAPDPDSTEFTPAFTGSDFGDPQLSTHGTDRLVTELQQGDVESGGEAVKGHKIFPETRKKVLDWLGHDEESSGHLGHALMQAGGAILSGGPIWQKALGQGITRGTEAYEAHKQAGLEEEATRQRMSLAQQEMEMRRRNYADSQADRQDRLRRERLQDQKTEADMFREGYRMKDGKLQWDQNWVEKSKQGLPYEDWGDSAGFKMRILDMLTNPNSGLSDQERKYYERVIGVEEEDAAI